MFMLNKKLWKISTTLLVLKLIFWLIYIGAVVYGANIQLTNDQMGYWGQITAGWLFGNVFWGMGVMMP